MQNSIQIHDSWRINTSICTIVHLYVLRMRNTRTNVSDGTSAFDRAVRYEQPFYHHGMISQIVHWRDISSIYANKSVLLLLLLLLRITLFVGIGSKYRSRKMPAPAHTSM